MKKLFIGLITLCICMQSFAAHVDPTAVTKIIDEFEYDMKVTWDQKDKTYFEKRRLEFLANLDVLREQGLTIEDVLSSVKSRISSSQMIVIKHRLEQLKANEISETETIEAIMQDLQSSRSQGAAWNGGVTIAYILSAGVIGLFVYVIVQVAKHGVNPKYCSPAGGWVDTNGDGYCNADEEVH